MFGPFWMARRALRSSGRGGGAGCLGFLLIAAVIGGIAGGNASHQAAAPPGWTQGSDGVFVPANPPPHYGTGGPDYAAGPAWTGPPLPAYLPPTPAAPAETSGRDPRRIALVLAIIALPLGILLWVGLKMKPKPIRTSAPPLPPPDFPPWEQLGGGGPTPHNPTQWSDSPRELPAGGEDPLGLAH